MTHEHNEMIMATTATDRVHWGRAISAAWKIFFLTLIFNLIALGLSMSEGEFYEAMETDRENALSSYFGGILIRTGGSLLIVFVGLVIVGCRSAGAIVRTAAATATLVPLPLQTLFLVLGVFAFQEQSISAVMTLVVLMLFISTFFLVIGVIAGLVSRLIVRGRAEPT